MKKKFKVKEQLKKKHIMAPCWTCKHQIPFHENAEACDILPMEVYVDILNTALNCSRYER